tara:strand:- start:1880 stop:2053 length:174 start_codon:yes stop_codon:yes gene_type:complete
MINPALKETLKKQIQKKYGKNPDLELKILKFIEMREDFTNAERNGLLDDIFETLKKK